MIGGASSTTFSGCHQDHDDEGRDGIGDDGRNGVEGGLPPTTGAGKLSGGGEGSPARGVPLAGKMGQAVGEAGSERRRAWRSTS